MTPATVTTAVDVRDVPKYPVYELVVTDGGSVTFDDELVAVQEGESPRKAGLRAAAAAAGVRDGVQAVRVRAVDPEGASALLVVTGAGEVIDAATSASSGKSRKPLVVMGALLAGLLVMAVVVVSVVVTGSGRSSAAAPAATTTVYSPPPSPKPVSLPVLGPQGSPVVAKWASDPLTDEAATVVVAHGLVIAPVVSGDDAAVQAIDARSSGVRWQHKVSGADDARVSLSADQATVYVVSDDVVAAVDARSGRQTWTHSVDSGSVVHAGATGVWVVTGDTTAQVRTASGAWQTRIVPPGAQIVAVASDGAALEVDRSGHAWRVTGSRVPGAMKTLPAPKDTGAAIGVVGVTARGVVTGWTSKDGKSTVLSVFAVGDDAQVPTRAERSMTVPGIASAVQPDDVEPSQDFMVSPDGSWVVTGGAVVSLTTGKVHATPDNWSVTSVTATAAWGTSNDAIVAIGPDGAQRAWRLNDTGQNVGLPVASAGTVGFVPADDGKTVRLYAVDLTGTTPTSSPAASSAAPSSSTSTKSTKAKAKKETRKPKAAKSTKAPAKKKGGKS